MFYFLEIPQMFDNTAEGGSRRSSPYVVLSLWADGKKWQSHFLINRFPTAICLPFLIGNASNAWKPDLANGRAT